MRSINLKIFKREIGKKGEIALLAVSLILIIILAYLVYKPNNKTVVVKQDISLVEDIPQPLEKFEDYGLVIEKLNKSVPIIPGIDIFDSNIYLKAIEKGVALSKDSKNPKENGNLFIFGHSEYLKNAKGDYKEIFKELNKLEKGDKFKIYYQSVPYTY